MDDDVNGEDDNDDDDEENEYGDVYNNHRCSWNISIERN